jgi:hypothetical protein
MKFGAGKTAIPLGSGGPLAGYAARNGCAAGTGAIAVGINPQGERRRSGGLGTFAGR